MAKAVKAKVANEKQIELNPSSPAQQVDADVIGRAAKIRAWVHA